MKTNFNHKHQDELRLEMLRLKLKKVHSVEDKKRIQQIQQELDEII